MITYRIGEGRSISGKILDRETNWFTNYDLAKEHALKIRKKIYVSVNNKKYIEIE